MRKLSFAILPLPAACTGEPSTPPPAAEADTLDAAAHGDDLSGCLGSIRDGRWTYLPYGPFDSRDSFQRWVTDAASSRSSGER